VEERISLFSRPIPNFSDHAMDIGGAREMGRPPKLTGDVRFRNGLAEVCSQQGDEPGNQHRHRTIILEETFK